MVAPEITLCEIMDIFQMERSGYGSKRSPKLVVSFLIAFCLLYMASMVYRSSTFVLIGEVAKDNGAGEEAENVTTPSGTGKSIATDYLSTSSYPIISCSTKQ